MMITPLHIGMVGGQPLRFFRTPNNDNLPDLPWHSVDDLYRCLGLNRQQRKHFLHMVKAKWTPVQTVATAEGIITIAPHFMAQGAIDAMIQEGMTPASARDDYDHASAAALKKLVPAYFPDDDWLAWIGAAMRRWDATTH